MTPLAENSLKSHKKKEKTCRTHKTGINILVPHQVHKTSTPFSTYSTYCNVVFEGFEQLLSKTLVAKKRVHFLNVSRVLKQFILDLFCVKPLVFAYWQNIASIPNGMTNDYHRCGNNGNRIVEKVLKSSGHINVSPSLFGAFFCGASCSASKRRSDCGRRSEEKSVVPTQLV